MLKGKLFWNIGIAFAMASGEEHVSLGFGCTVVAPVSFIPVVVVVVDANVVVVKSSVVAQAKVVIDGSVADALIGFVASILGLVRTDPVGSALVTSFSFPSGMTNALVLNTKKTP